MSWADEIRKEYKEGRNAQNEQRKNSWVESVRAEYRPHNAALDAQKSSWFKEAGDFIQQSSAGLQERSKAYQDAGTFEKYRQDTASRAKKLLQDSDPVRELAARIVDEKQRKQYLDTVAGMQQYLSAVPKDLDSLKEYWSQWGSQADYEQAIRGAERQEKQKQARENMGKLLADEEARRRLGLTGISVAHSTLTEPNQQNQVAPSLSAAELRNRIAELEQRQKEQENKLKGSGLAGWMTDTFGSEKQKSRSFSEYDSQLKDEITSYKQQLYYAENDEALAAIPESTRRKMEQYTARAAARQWLNDMSGTESVYDGTNAKVLLKNGKRYTIDEVRQLSSELKDDELGSLYGEIEALGMDGHKLLKYMQLKQGQEFVKLDAEETRQVAHDHPILTSAASILHTPFKVAGIMDTGATALSNAITGQEAPVDYSQSVYDSARYQSSARGQVSDDLGGGLGSFLYQTGMSMGDFLTLAPLAAVPGGQSAVTAILGGGAAADTAMDISGRGGTASQAFWGGLAAGAAEAAFEKFSLEAILKAGNVTGVKSFITELLKGAGIEGSEEVATEISNIISDQLIMGDKSNYSLAVQAYMQSGMNRQEAEKAARLDLLKQVGTAFAGGALSGGLIHAVHGGANYAGNTHLGGDIIQNNQVRDAIRMGFESDVDSPAYRAAVELSEQMVNGEKLSPARVGAIVADAQQQAVSRQGADLRQVAQEAVNGGNALRADTNAHQAKNAKFAASDASVRTLKDIGVDTAQAQVDSRLADRTSVEQNLQGNRDASIGTKAAAMLVSDIENAVPVRVEGIDSVSENGMTVTLENGETAAITDVQFENPQVESLYYAAANYETNTARAFVSGYNGSVPLKTYKTAFDFLHNQAMRGVPFETAVQQLRQSAGLVSQMVGTQAQYMAYHSGVNEAAALKNGGKSEELVLEKSKSSDRGAAEPKANVEGAKHFRKGVTKEYQSKELTSAQRKQLSILDAYGKTHGLSFVIVDTIEDGRANGYYKDGVIRIALDAQEQGYLVTAGHEVFHYLEEKAPEQTAKLREYVCGELKNSMGADAYEALVQERMAQYNTTDRLLAESEIAANGLFDVFRSESAVQRLAKTNRALALKVRTALTNFLHELNKIVVKLSANREEIAALRGNAEVLQEIAERFDEALNAAQGTKKAAQKNGGRYSFAGTTAKTADIKALSQARKMQNEGADSEAIRQETGWFQGYDGKWRFEIDDSKAVFRKGGDVRLMRDAKYRRLTELTEKFGKGDLSEAETVEMSHLEDEFEEQVWSEKYLLSDFLEHADLYDAYPMLEFANLAFDELPGGQKGYYLPQSNTIVLSNMLFGKEKNTLMHEIQHIIQKYEGFAKGSSPGYWRTKMEDGYSKRDKNGIEFMPSDLYRATAGEIEARDVTSRMDMTPNQRKSTRPDVDREEVVFAEDGISYSLREGAKDDVERALSDTKYRDDVYLTESSPSIIASQKGVRNLPMLMKASHIRENVFTEEEAKILGLKVDEHTHYHGLGKDLFLKIIDGLDDVNLAYRGTKNANDPSRRENYFLLISQYKDAKGNIVNVPVYIDEKGQYNRVFIDTNKIATVFGRDNFFAYIQKEIKKGNLVRIKNRSTQASERTALIAGGYSKNAPNDPNVPQSTEVVNTSISETSAKDTGRYSLKTKAVNSDGETLTEGQAQYFENSQARDGEGRLLVVYHATDAEFTVFDKAKQGSANDPGVWGSGFYFDTDQSFAEEFGSKSKPYYLNITNPLRTTYDADCHVVAGIFRRAGIDIPFKIKPDTSLLQFIKKFGNRKFSDTLQALGYDGVIVSGEECVIFEPEQAKLTSNESPTSAPDMRYQLSEIDKLVGEYGSIPPGENPAREVEVPRKTSAKMKVRQFVRTVLESKQLTDDMVQDVDEEILKEALSYVPISDKEAMRQAKNKVHTDMADAYRQWTAVADGKAIAGKREFALGEALLTAAAEDGNRTQVIRLTAELAVEATRAAQTLQSTRLLKKMGGMGQLYYVTRVVDKLNRDLEPRIEKGKAQKIQIDEDLALALAEAKNPKELQAAADDLLYDIAQQMPVTWLDKWNAWRYFAMLANPRTHFRNIAGNAVFVPAVRLKSAIKTGLEAAIIPHVKEAERTSSLTASAENKAFAAKDFEELKEFLQSGGKMNPESKLRDMRRIFNTGWLETSRKFSGWALDAEDVNFLRRHYIYAMSHWLESNGLKGENVDLKTLERARAYAAEEAWKATYRDASAAATAIAQAGKVPGLNVVVEGLMPFKKTPINVFKRGVEYSPVGLLKALSYGFVQLKRKKITVNELLDGIAAGLSGTAITILGVVLRSLGILVGGFSDDREDELKRLTGEQEYAIQLGNVSYTVDWLSPVAMPLFVGAELGKMFEGEYAGTGPRDWLSAMLGITEPMFSLSMLDGLNSTIQAAAYSENPLTTILTESALSYGTQAVPTVLGQLARTIDGTRRTTYTDKNSPVPDELQRAWQKVQNKLPGLTFLSQPYVDNWGNKDEQPNLAMRAFENFLSPGYISKVSADTIEQELSKLYDATGENALLPTRQAKYFNVGDERIDLTAKDYTVAQTIRGQTAYAILKDTMSDPQYQALSDTGKAQAVKDAYSFANAVAKAGVSEYELDGWIKGAYQLNRDYGVPVGQIILGRAADADQKVKKEDVGYTYRPADIAAALEYGGLKSAQDAADILINEVKEQTSSLPLKEQKKKLDAKISAIKSGITGQYKKLYIAAFKRKDFKETQSIMRLLIQIRVNGKRLFTQDDFKSWNKDAQKKE